MQAPRLHAVIVEPEACAKFEDDPSLLNAASQRHAALQFLREICGGDELAAMYLLLQLLSKCASAHTLFAWPLEDLAEHPCVGHIRTLSSNGNTVIPRQSLMQ